MRVFVAHPYTSDDPEEKIENIYQANKASRDLLARGHTPIATSVLTAMWEYDPRLKYEDLIRLSLEWLRLCEAVVILGDSPGVRLEKAEAETLGIPIYYSLEEVPDVS